ncbi:TRAP-type C4-dicarboxylate transport system, small permease component [Tistlia consotensis]|uniref:TRAP transporter small permease protein n=1 Tax=Tistlia consotensis USBA 355 TaxID=560819 RepID=A0A1Y6CAS6_9PROT|nr:TRAP transporter small permease subunit [Tistlia consotensis]SMF51985.1 TRAP-type C4-dicarboxylate transport system, small permease component [Tistlia consotensis USBA 355]SNR83489.1 TRAP-type C4-dicarboxylate transport system, small permease component [Tistlia consotensis]
MVPLLRLIVALSRAVVLAAFAVIVGAVAIQIVARSFLPHSPVWTEELTRFALLYLAAAGAGLALRSRDLVDVDIAVAALPPRGRRAMRILACLATLLLAVAMFGPSLDFTAIGTFQTSPTLGWPMSLVHVVTTIAAGSLGLFALAEIAELLLAPHADVPAGTGRD